MIKILDNLDLSKKFNLILILVVIAGVVLSGTAFSSVLNQNASNVVTSKALLLMETISSVRNYTNNQINPLLESRLETEAAFLPQTVPAYSAREVFENLRQHPDYKDFSYKEATLNPTNLRDQSDRFETSLVESFRKNKNLKQLNGYLSLPNEQLFYIARPIPVNEATCLRCHSTPAAAPKSQIATYGSKNGFNWKLNEVVGAQVIYVPASGIINAANQAFWLFIGIVAAAFLVAIAITNVLIRLVVVRPIKRIVKVANDVSTGNLNAEFDQSSHDEIGMLSTAFNRMKVSIAIALDLLNQGKGN